MESDILAKIVEDSSSTLFFYLIWISLDCNNADWVNSITSLFRLARCFLFYPRISPNVCKPKNSNQNEHRMYEDFGEDLANIYNNFSFSTVRKRVKIERLLWHEECWYLAGSESLISVWFSFLPYRNAFQWRIPANIQNFFHFAEEKTNKFCNFILSCVFDTQHWLETKIKEKSWMLE